MTASVQRMPVRLFRHRRLPEVIDDGGHAMADHFRGADLDREPHGLRPERIEHRPHRFHPLWQARALGAPAGEVFRRMGMRVDEPWHGEPAAGIDQLARGIMRHGCRRRQTSDAAVLDQDIGGLQPRPRALGIEHASVGDEEVECRLHGISGFDSAARAGH
jgi:hypothetical protein